MRIDIDNGSFACRLHTKEDFLVYLGEIDEIVLEWKENKIAELEKELKNILKGVELTFNVSEINKIPMCIDVYIFTVRQGYKCVGRSDNIRQRMYSHERTQRIYPIETIIVIRVYTHEESKKLEKLLIVKIRPEINRNRKLRR